MPNFQRGFVWDDRDVRDLFDSVWRGFPLGTLLLWRSSADAGEVKLGPLSIPVPARHDALWVVDGQQRITSLVATLRPKLYEYDRRFDVYFDLRRGRFHTGTGRTPPPTWLPLSQALETRSLLSWLREHTAELEPEDFDSADALGAALREYQVPAYIVTSEDDYLLRNIFDRVNSAGKPIGRTEIFHALFASETEPGSPETVVNSLDRRLGFGRIEPARVLQSLLAIRGGNVQRDLRDEFERGEDVSDWYSETEEALALAIRYLRDEGIPHLTLMPSTLPLPVLAAFFYLHPDPDPWTRRLLGRWLWRGWAHGFGSRGQTPALRQAIYSVNPKKGDASQAPAEDDAALSLIATVPVGPLQQLRLDPFRTESAAARLALLALASLRPLAPDGSEVKVTSAFEEHGVGAVTEIVRGRRGEVGARGLWPVGLRPPTGEESSAVLKSHAITNRSVKFLRDRKIDDFVKTRGAFIESLVRNFVNTRMEEKALNRRSLSSLIVPDEE
nr:DUF262 domain-containing protein [Asanoa ishikariensis]